MHILKVVAIKVREILRQITKRRHTNHNLISYVKDHTKYVIIQKGQSYMHFSTVGITVY